MNIKITTETLTDGSCAFDVRIRQDDQVIVLHAIDYEAAEHLMLTLRAMVNRLCVEVVS